ncbi:MAG: patatin-like phospholipase family protein [Jatrophihabitantaceae bacterium]
MDSDIVAFVLQGGGSLTAPQVGMLRALTEAGITPDLLVGSSAGALNAVAFASNPTLVGLDELEALWLSLNRKRVAPFSARTLYAVLRGRGDGLVPNTGLRELIDGARVAPRLQDASIAVHTVATDVATGETIVLSTGATVSALLASCAFPGLYPPVRVNGRVVVDGGVSADAPVLQAEALGADVIYLLPAAGADESAAPRGPLPLAYHALGQVLDAAVRRDIAAVRSTLHILPATTSSAGSPVDFSGTARLMADGYRLATGWVADVLRASQSSAQLVRDAV